MPLQPILHSTDELALHPARRIASTIPRALQAKKAATSHSAWGPKDCL
jgi:hypothetical protein